MFYSVIERLKVVLFDQSQINEENQRMLPHRLGLNVAKKGEIEIFLNQDPNYYKFITQIQYFLVRPEVQIDPKSVFASDFSIESTSRLKK